jgi:hypothetical protein
MSTTAGKNNFKNPEVCKAACYKIWILYKPQFANKYNRKTSTIYGYNNKRNHGLDNLVKLAGKKQGEADLIALYDNKSGKLMRYLYQSIQPKTKQQPYTPVKQQTERQGRQERHKRKRIIQPKTIQ